MGQVYHIRSRNEPETPWTSPASYEPEPPRKTVLDTLCNAFVDSIAFLFDNALAIGLGFIFGMIAVLLPAMVIAGVVR